jgi:CRISPR-associated exonuclease Cas4
VILFFTSIVILIISKKISKEVTKTKKIYKIPTGKIAYTDLNKSAKALFSKKYRMTGKPDYIIKTGRFYLPIEVKTGLGNKPQKSHVLQLAAYCHLIEENYGCFVPYGILIYNNLNEFKIPFNPAIRFELESTIKKMRFMITTDRVLLNHNDFTRCKNCSMKQYCNIKIN